MKGPMTPESSERGIVQTAQSSPTQPGPKVSILWLRQAVAREPGNAQRHFALAAELERQGDLEGATEEFREALRLKPDDPEIRTALGVVLFLRSERGAATKELTEVIKSNPDYGPAHYEIGTMWYKSNDLSRAIRELREAVRLMPGEASPHLVFAQVLDADGDRQGAITEIRLAIQLQPDNAAAHRFLATELAKIGDPNGAVSEYRAGLRIEPDDADARFALGEQLYVKALQAVAAAAKAADPRGSKEAFQLALLSAPLLGPTRDAVAEFRKAVSLRPDWARAHFALAQALDLNRETSAALLECASAIALEPTNSEFLDKFHLLVENLAEQQRRRK